MGQLVMFDDIPTPKGHQRRPRRKPIWREPTTFDLGLTEEEQQQRLRESVQKLAEPKPRKKAPGRAPNPKPENVPIVQNNPPPDRSAPAAMNQRDTPVVWYVLDSIGKRATVRSVTSPVLVYDYRRRAALMLTATKPDKTTVLLVMPEALQQVGYTVVYQHFAQVCYQTGLTPKVIAPNFMEMSRRLYRDTPKAEKPAPVITL